MTVGLRKESGLRGKAKALSGFLVILAGVILMIYGIYTTFGFQFVASNVKAIVTKGLVYTIVGGVVFIEGVVIQGFKKVYALILHLAAIIPYYLAIQEILRVANTGSIQSQQYFTASQYYFLAAAILNILGIAANNLRRTETVVAVRTK